MKQVLGGNKIEGQVVLTNTGIIEKFAKGKYGDGKINIKIILF